MLQATGGGGMTRERWRPVVGYETTYAVSSLGRVRREGARTGATVGRVLRPIRHPNGYLQVSLSQDNKRLTRWLHRVVAEAFIGPRPAGHHIDHVDGDPTNNAVANLRYVTPAENVRLSCVGGRHAVGRMMPQAKLTERAVLEIRALAGIVPQGELAARFRVTQPLVSRIQRGEKWAHVQAPARAS